MKKKLQKIYLTYYNLLIAQDIWQVHYQVLSIIFLKKLIELNVNLDIYPPGIMKNKHTNLVHP